MLDISEDAFDGRTRFRTGKVQAVAIEAVTKGMVALIKGVDYTKLDSIRSSISTEARRQKKTVLTSVRKDFKVGDVTHEEVLLVKCKPLAVVADVRQALSELEDKKIEFDVEGDEFVVSLGVHVVNDPCIKTAVSKVIDAFMEEVGT